MLDRIDYYCEAHNGDVFESRGIVSWMAKNIPAKKQIFHHWWSPKLCCDIPNIEKEEVDVSHERETPWKLENNCLYANVAPMVRSKYWQGCSIQTYYNAMVGELRRELGMVITEDILNFIPEVDYSFFQIENIKKFMEEHKNQKKIFIANNNVRSLQSENFDFNPIVSALAKMYPDILFFMTNSKSIFFKENKIWEDHGKVIMPNIFYNEDIIQLKGDDPCDLMETSYISTFCDLIIGRASGPFTCTYTKRNIQQSTKKFLMFCGLCFDFGLNRYYPGRFVNYLYRGNENAVNVISNFIRQI